MSRGPRHRLENVRPIVEELHAYLGKKDKVAAAGSVRRQSPTVGDIETVFIGQETRLLLKLDYMLFNGMIEPLGTAKSATSIRQGKRFYRFVLFPPPTWNTDISWIKWDLFLVKPPADYPVILWQRTGPAEYTQDMYLNGLKQPRFRICRGALWEIAKEDRPYTKLRSATELAKMLRSGSVQAKRLSLSDEEALYNRAFLVPYTEPRDRTLQTLSEQLQQMSEIDRRRMLLNNLEV